MNGTRISTTDSGPPGLPRLSSTTIVITSAERQYLLDHGSTYGGGTATHSLTLYRHANGALVFGAGTVQWPWGLDTNHDRGSPPPLPGNPAYPAFAQALHDMRQATMNLFTDMGVPPATPQAGLVVGARLDRLGEARLDDRDSAGGVAAPGGIPGRDQRDRCGRR